MDLKKHIARHLKEKYAAEVAEDESLFERGYLDSMALLELMSFIEESTGVRVPDTEVLPENFETIASIDALVRRLQS
jgi:acyl carrier protein